MSRWKAIGWTVAFFASGIAATIATGLTLKHSGAPISGLWLGVVAQIAGFGLATWLIGRVALKWDLADLRWRGTGAPGRGFGVGADDGDPGHASAPASLVRGAWYVVRRNSRTAAVPTMIVAMAPPSGPNALPVSQVGPTVA